MSGDAPRDASSHGWRTFARLLGFLRPYTASLVVSSILAIASQIAGILVPVLTGVVINELSADPDTRVLALEIAAVIALGLLRGLLMFGRRMISGRQALGVEYDLRDELYSHFLRLSFGFYDRSQTGQLMSRATIDLQAVRFFLGYGLIFFAQHVVTIVVVTAVLFAYSWQLALVSLAITPAVALTAYRYSRVSHPVLRDVQQSLGEVATVAEESIVGVHVVKSFSQEERREKSFAAAAESVFGKAIDANRQRALYVPLLTFLPLVAQALVLLAAGRMVISGSLSLGAFFAFNLLLAMLVMPLRMLGMWIGQAQRAVAAGERIFEILDEPEEVADAPLAQALPAGAGGVSFHEQLAASNRRSRDALLLKAAEAWRDEGDLAELARVLDEVRPKRLTPAQAAHLDLLLAESALAQGDAQRALDLATLPEGSLDRAYRTRVPEIRARALLATGRPIDSARERALLDLKLSGPDRAANQDDLLDALAAADVASLNAALGATGPDDALRPWLERALRLKGTVPARVMPRPTRQAGALFADADGGRQREGYASTAQVALLLPLSGPLGSAGGAIRDGFLAAFFADPDLEARPRVRILDTGETVDGALEAYRLAVEGGATRVVGPLAREQVAAVQEAQTVPVPVLALNHPDNGAVPPRGSQQFGLLPDEEAAVAADAAIARGLRRAALLGATEDWSERALLAFRAQFEQGGGTITGRGAPGAGCGRLRRPDRAGHGRRPGPDLPRGAPAAGAPAGAATAHPRPRCAADARDLAHLLRHGQPRAGPRPQWRRVLRRALVVRARRRTAGARAAWRDGWRRRPAARACSPSAWTPTACCPTSTGWPATTTPISRARSASSRSTASAACGACRYGCASTTASRAPPTARSRASPPRLERARRDRRRARGGGAGHAAGSRPARCWPATCAVAWARSTW